MSPATANTADLDFALELAAAAADIALPLFESANFTVYKKPDRTYVTDADKAVENKLRSMIADRYPHDAFYGEETGTAAGSAPRTWILDPIDGTANFLRGVPNWATLIALEVTGQTQLGVCSMPALDTRWWALQGQGSYKQRGQAHPQKISVSKVSDLADASISFQSIQQWEEAGYLEQLLTLRRSVWRDRAYGDAWSYMALCEGLIDMVGEFDVKSYDIAAMIPLVTEAGGVFTDAHGNTSSWEGSAVASNGLIHSAVLDKINPRKDHK